MKISIVVVFMNHIIKVQTLNAMAINFISSIFFGQTFMLLYASSFAPFGLWRL